MCLDFKKHLLNSILSYFQIIAKSSQAPITGVIDDPIKHDRVKIVTHDDENEIEQVKNSKENNIDTLFQKMKMLEKNEKLCKTKLVIDISKNRYPRKIIFEELIENTKLEGYVCKPIVRWITYIEKNNKIHHTFKKPVFRLKKMQYVVAYTVVKSEK